MCFVNIHLIILIVVLNGRASLLEVCDEAQNLGLREGNQGEVAMFPWLGILRVHFHEGANLRIALTGLVLVKEKFALVNADDVTKIPHNILISDSKAMFIISDTEPWYCKLKDYMTHPEYEYSTYNTIAIVQLDLKDDDDTIKPMCLPSLSYNTSNLLYAIGYVDDNQLLEKVFYKLQYVNQAMCKEFYSRAETQIQDTRETPTHYHCAFTVNNKGNCVWDNGMVLASNSTGIWTLIGFGIRGPGCGAPARFIDIFPYMPWIETVTTLDSNEYVDFRKKADNHNQKAQGDFEDTESRKLFSDLQNISLVDEKKFSIEHPFDIENQKLFMVDRIDKNEINIRAFNISYEDNPGGCWNNKYLVYKELIKLVTKHGKHGKEEYKVSLSNMFVKGYTCVTIQLNGHNHTDSHIFYTSYMEIHDGLNTEAYTPKELLKHFPIANTTTPLPEKVWNPEIFKRDEHAKRNNSYSHIMNVNVLIKFKFISKATVTIFVFGAHPSVKKKSLTHKVTRPDSEIFGSANKISRNKTTILKTKPKTKKKQEKNKKAVKSQSAINKKGKNVTLSVINKKPKQEAEKRNNVKKVSNINITHNIKNGTRLKKRLKVKIKNETVSNRAVNDNKNNIGIVNWTVPSKNCSHHIILSVTTMVGLSFVYVFKISSVSYILKCIL